MPDLLDNPAPNLSIGALGDIARDLFGLDGTVHLLDSERDQNALVEIGGGRFTIKVANTAEAAGTLDFESAALSHVAAVDPDLPVPRVIPTLDGGQTGRVDVDGARHQVRALTYLTGMPVPAGPIPADMASTIGATLGRLQRALRGFFHPAAGRRLLWDARRAGELVSWVDSLADPETRALAGHVLAVKAAATLPKLMALPSQVVHNDFHRDNLLTDPADPTRLSGILDFGDSLHAPRIQDLAVAAMYAALEHPDPGSAVAAVIDGYCRVAEIEPGELEILPDLVSIRLAQSLTIAAHRAALHPENVDYIHSDSPEIEAALHLWESLPAEGVRAALESAAAMPPGPMPTAGVAARRNRFLWSGLGLSYQEPLHLVEGQGVWLRDAEGRRYLHAYNNVPQVGHANHRVVRAASQQASRLNTNTRYLTDPVVRLAEQLADRLPGPLEVCLFVNSGSEANDLAWRIARTVTGEAGAIVTKHAYHGFTGDIYALSPEERPPEEAPEWVATMAAPGSTGPGVDDALEQLRKAGHSPAGLWVDATFSSDGIYAPPTGFLSSVARAVREQGGLFIADEVQGGLGRVGLDYWAFAVDELAPDIVTLGKPLGNGFPIGAVVTTREIADRFAGLGYFFSTFGGNPVAAAAASTVLHLTDELGLPERAEEVGAALLRGMGEALDRAPGGVRLRGRGAFIGAEMADAGTATALVEGLRGAGVLVGLTGPLDSVVKIRPPLVFDAEHAERLLEATAAVASEIW
jgi:4-aminobutyrate aminotransferase-like enzyme/Ser/Thr protein kinase RdoA (MazF antagonist)